MSPTRRFPPTYRRPPRLEFKDRRFHLTDGANRYTFGLHVKPGKDRYTVVFFDPEKELDEELNFTRLGGLLKLKDGLLTLCLCHDLTKTKAFPEDFKAEAGSGHVLLDF